MERCPVHVSASLLPLHEPVFFFFWMMSLICLGFGLNQDPAMLENIPFIVPPPSARRPILQALRLPDQ